MLETLFLDKESKLVLEGNEHYYLLHWIWPPKEIES